MLRRANLPWSVSAGVLLTVLVACSTPTPVPAPAPVPPPVPTPEQDWHSAGDFPVPKSPRDRLWMPDGPKPLAPLAYGKVPSEHPRVVTRPVPSEVKLEAVLPQAPEQLPVYLVSGYLNANEQTLEQRVNLPHADCTFYGMWAEITCSSAKDPTGSTQPIDSPDQAEQRAKALVQRLWMPDLTTYAVDALPDGGWRVVFAHGIAGMPIYSDRAFQVHLNRNGQLVDLIERRRPAIARSDYPIRPPGDAWQALQAGRYLALDLIWGAHAPKAGEPFVIRKVEIGYVVTHANDVREIMQPYYIFRTDKRQALFVPAVADPNVTWPD